ncbi:hypothetical protein [Halobacterium bonnevillei]|uniref:Uncharacterized protein n=1 Tax=Halobacterium bonnevillei TaxID=2692200 RepID=A0A6B0SLA9_9EURY|nr:hypothetical protein [Halobacterium bonnevillei]MXR20333.1 hypothetical protein [Halobacterium bonnevillei]
MEWVDYLVENREFSGTIGGARVPLCGRCYGERDQLHSSYEEDVDVFAEDGVEATAGIAAFLDDFDLEAVEDDALQ